MCKHLESEKPMARRKLLAIMIVGSIFVILLQHDYLPFNTIHFYKTNYSSRLFPAKPNVSLGSFSPKKPKQIELHKTEKLKSISQRFNPLRHLTIYNPRNVSHILLVGYYRSGSSFLGDLLQQNWKSFYTYEPLHYMTRQTRIDGSTNTTEAFQLIRNIFECQFDEHAHSYLQWVRDNSYLLRWNKFYWSVSRFRDTQFDHVSLHETCIRSKFNIIKSVRLQLKHLQPLYDQLKNMRLKMIFLVRDPRGIYNSRKSMEWCNTEKICYDISYICQEMRQDLEDYDRVRHVIGDANLILLKYEDLANDTDKIARQLFAKLDLPYSSSVARFVRTHTNSRSHTDEDANPYSTYRHNSTITANQWMSKLNGSEIQIAQTHCLDILQRFHYPLV